MQVFRSGAAAMIAAVAFAACTGLAANRGGSLPVVQAIRPAVERGKILSLNKVTTITRLQMSTGQIAGVVSEIGGKPKCDVTLYAIVYQTIGVHGEPANASEAFMVPQTGCKGPFPLVGYAHGTNLAKNQLITNPKTSSPDWTAPDQNPIIVAAIFGAHGYAVSATDYLGLGLSTYPYHPYLQVDSEASAVIDAMRAARTAATMLHVPLNGKVVIAGHSQGGQVSVGTQRAIEAETPTEFSLAGTIASSGPYALSQTFEDALRHQSQDAPILAAYILTGYNKTYGNLYTSPTTIFQNPYASGIDTLLPVDSYKAEAALEGKTLPLQLSALLQRSWVQSFLNDARSPARVDTHINDLLYGWKPKATIYLCGGDRDPEVEFKNAILAHRYFTAIGAKAPLFDVNPLVPPAVPLKYYHVTVAVICLPYERGEYFDGIVTSN